MHLVFETSDVSATLTYPVRVYACVRVKLATGSPRRKRPYTFMEIIKRYYEYPVLQEKIKALEAANSHLEKQLAESAACRLADIKSWNSAFELERKGLQSHIQKLETQLLKVFGLSEDITAVTDGTSGNKPQPTSSVNRPGIRSIENDRRTELKEIQFLENASDEELMGNWLRMMGALEAEALDESRLEPDVGTQGR